MFFLPVRIDEVKDGLVEGQICGLLTILIASASGIQGQRQELAPSVVVNFGKEKLATAEIQDYPGLDINNPSFDTPFRVLLTSDHVSAGSLRVAPHNKKQEVGSAEVSLDAIKKASRGILEENLDVGNGTKIRACFYLRGLTPASGQESTLAHR